MLEDTVARELAEMVKEHVRKEIAMAMQPLLERLVSAEFEIRAIGISARAVCRLEARALIAPQWRAYAALACAALLADVGLALRA